MQKQAFEDQHRYKEYRYHGQETRQSRSVLNFDESGQRWLGQYMRDRMRSKKRQIAGRIAAAMEKK